MTQEEKQIRNAEIDNFLKWLEVGANRKPIILENESGKEVSLQTVQPYIIDEKGVTQAEKEICLLVGDEQVFLTDEQAEKVVKHLQRLEKRCQMKK